MEILFLWAGLPFLAIGVFVILSELRARRGAAEVPGMVVGYSRGKSAAGAGSFCAVAEFVGIDGRRRYVVSSVGSSTPLGWIGDTLTVLVHPEDPEKASIKSSLSFVLGGAIALMGLVSCGIFVAMFRSGSVSIAASIIVTVFAAYKLSGSLRDKPLSLEAWRRYKEKALGPKVFSEADKAQIAWAEPGDAQTAALGREQARRWVSPILIAAGAGILFLSQHLYKKNEAFLATAVGAPGKVVEMSSSHSSDGMTYAPVVEFELQGRKIRFKDSTGSNPPSYRVADDVRVLHDPADPAHARIDRGRWNRAVPLLVGAFGAIFLVAGLWSLKSSPATSALSAEQSLHEPRKPNLPV